MAKNRDTLTTYSPSGRRPNARLAAAWALLTDPHPSMTDVNERSQARMLAALQLPLPLVIVFYFLTRSEDSFMYATTTIGLAFLLAIVMVVSYVFSRTRHYKLGVYVLVFSIITLATTSVVQDPRGEVLYFAPLYLSLSLILSSLFLSVRATFGIALLTICLLSALWGWLPEYQSPLLVGQLRYLALLYILVLISTLLRARHERQIARNGETLRESESLYRTLFEETIEPTSIHDNGVIVAVNPAMEKFTGYTQAELKGRSVLEFVHADLHTQVLSRVPAGEMGHEVLLKDRHGDEMPACVFTKPIRYQGKEMSLLSIRDLRLQKMAESVRLENAIQNDRQKVLQQLIRNLSHDFRTPLTVIKTSLYMLQHSTHDVPRHQKHLDVVQLQTNRLQEMMDDFIALARLDYVRKSDLTVASVDVNQVIEGIVETHQVFAKKRGVSLSFRGTGARELHFIDKDALQRITKSLVSNGLLYTPSGGVVEVSARTEGESLYLYVQDNGIGISAEQMPHIFEPFYRVDPMRSTETGGAGLGLTIAKKLLDVLGGDIQIESEVGRGSCFRVRIPFIEPEQDEEEDFDLVTEVSA